MTTYAELAKALGSPRASRAVGNALNKNPHAFTRTENGGPARTFRGGPQLPCHRVVCSDGRLGGYAGGSNKKIALLQSESLIIKNNKIENFAEKLFKF